MGIISIQKRNRADGGYSSNNYILYDFHEMWGAGNQEEVAQAIEKIDIQKATELLQNNGFKVIKKESLEEATDQSNT
ncbi:hypothetical protein C8E03_11123 [Lachnotalea glycerini]|uniref:Uncharacterized protein n=1 Tax=Lachnotalea glycerini TaxID=1763509 RepID=A0A255JFZ0_9FIRM|nr:hypothetical protein [Lachnotalea glycerini]OYO51498.1 hypothetical protein CG709_19370 [Lachnotalea glycerini]PXV86823.1 hypothetical protein C8E03_11123 [Lachnotalea glycerini]RDY29587.1 hypothetical protein CG710_018125 [Lachnotalea glycerini]